MSTTTTPKPATSLGIVVEMKPTKAGFKVTILTQQDEQIHFVDADPGFEREDFVRIRRNEKARRTTITFANNLSDSNGHGFTAAKAILDRQAAWYEKRGIGQ